MRHFTVFSAAFLPALLAAGDFPTPHSPPSTEREGVFEFTQRPEVKILGNDQYEITFAVKGNCDVCVRVVDEKGAVVRHLGAGVLGPNAPAPFQKNALRQTVVWNGKDDLLSYVKEPEKLRVKISLGLKPTFEKLLGSWDPHNVPGVVIGLAVGEDGAYVFSKGDHSHLRRFDHDGNYLGSLVPPPSTLGAEKLQGCSYIEYEPGKRALHASKLLDTLAGYGYVLTGLNAAEVSDLQPALSRGRLYYLNGGSGYFQGKALSMLHYINADGSTDLVGLKGRPFLAWYNGGHQNVRLAASPDGKWLYMLNPGLHAVFRCATDGEGSAEVFLGKNTAGKGKAPKIDPGSDHEGLNNPAGLDCDAQGRLYVADSRNNRLQIVSPEGKLLKSLPVDRPTVVRLHQKSGALYVFHYATVQGRSITRLTKFSAFDTLREEFHVDQIPMGLLAVDSWTPQPRLWLGGDVSDSYNPSAPNKLRGPNVTIWEEDGASLRKLVDFNAIAKRQAGENDTGGWSAGIMDHVNCDPTREQLYWQGFRNNPWVFDLKTGRKLKRLHMPTSFNDLSFDKKGYLHAHLDPGFGMPGVVRLDPDRQTDYANMWGKQPGFVWYPEVPYDYGEEISRPQAHAWRGAIPVKDQPGAKFFQDGFGVSMRGDLAENANIYHTPRMEEVGFDLAVVGGDAKITAGKGAFGDWGRAGYYAKMMRDVQEQQKRGEEVYSIPRRPGVPLAGATIWTYESTGELRQECAVTAGGTLAGTLLDEDGFLYFSAITVKLYNGKVFLHGQKGYYGSDKPLHQNDRCPFTATHFKTKGRDVKFLRRGATIPLEPPLARPTDVVTPGPFGDPEFGSNEIWAEGAEWLYAGAGPVSAAGCTCPSMRPHLDWDKRSYVPEAYRHSIGILDTAGNLILHLGRYGNNDDALAMKPGTEDVRLYLPRFISGTDHYLAFDDWGERLVQLRLAYHAEESVGLENK